MQTLQQGLAQNLLKEQQLKGKINSQIHLADHQCYLIVHTQVVPHCQTTVRVYCHVTTGSLPALLLQWVYYVTTASPEPDQYDSPGEAVITQSLYTAVYLTFGNRFIRG